jgi:hypothetical protein
MSAAAGKAARRSVWWRGLALAGRWIFRACEGLGRGLTGVTERPYRPGDNH